MSKKIIVAMLLFLFAGTGSLCAQQLVRKQIQSIAYYDEQHLMRKGNTITVLNFSLEWPERVANSDVPVLQRYLCFNVFKMAMKPLKQAKAEFVRYFGEEINAMPQEGGLKKSYVTIRTKMLAWEENSFLSMKIVKSVRSEGSVKPDYSETILFTYDILGGKILETNDILRADSQRAGSYASYLNYDIYSMCCFLGLDENIEFKDMPDQACLMPKGVQFNLKGSHSDLDEETTLFMPLNVMGDYIRKSIYTKFYDYLNNRRLRQKFNKKESRAAEFADMADGSDAVYDVVPEMPQFEGGEAALMSFLASNTMYPSEERNNGVEGKVVVQFTVNADGTVSDAAVIKPVSPALDRVAVKSILSMPKWKPGKYNGQAVNVRVVVPVTFKIG